MTPELSDQVNMNTDGEDSEGGRGYVERGVEGSGEG